VKKFLQGGETPLNRAGKRICSHLKASVAAGNQEKFGGRNLLSRKREKRMKRLRRTRGTTREGKGRLNKERNRPKKEDSKSLGKRRY